MTNYNTYIDKIVPIGVILPFAGSLIPSTFFVCDGAPLTYAPEYEELFSKIGYMYGGSGSIFYLPDYQDYFVRGFDEGGVTDPNYLTRTGSATIGSTQADGFQNHKHSVYYEYNSGTVVVPPAGTTIHSKMDRVDDKGDYWGGSYVSRLLNYQIGYASDTRPDNMRVTFAIRGL